MIKWITAVPVATTCENGGNEDVNGNCICPDVYFGAKCELECINGQVDEGTCVCDDGFSGLLCDNGMLTDCNVFSKDSFENWHI